MRVVVISVVGITLGEVFGTSERARTLGHIVSSGGMRDAGSRLPSVDMSRLSVSHTTQKETVGIYRY